jgi:hypothetical protein
MGWICCGELKAKYLLSLLRLLMTKGLKTYCSLIGRCLLLTGYLFLFAGQFNCRYFSIANFFVYGNAGTGSRVQPHTGGNVTHAAGVLQIERARHGVAVHDNGERATHLCIDKRFDLKQGVRVPQIRAPGLPYYTIVKTRRPTLTPACSSTDLLFTSLRGPPCA